VFDSERFPGFRDAFDPSSVEWEQHVDNITQRADEISRGAQLVHVPSKRCIKSQHCDSLLYRLHRPSGEYARLTCFFLVALFGIETARPILSGVHVKPIPRCLADNSLQHRCKLGWLAFIQFSGRYTHHFRLPARATGNETGGRGRKPGENCSGGGERAHTLQNATVTGNFGRGIVRNPWSMCMEPPSPAQVICC